jgi:ribosomal protein L44E
MKFRFCRTVAPLIARVQKLFSEDLGRENDFLHQENEILRSKLGKRVPLTESDRRTLVRYGLLLTDRLPEVISIVRPETLLAWNRRMKRRKWTFENTHKRPGRPSKAKATEALALRMARETAWGYVRIAGELKKLRHEVSASCVRDMLKKHELPPSPQRKGLSWK